MAIGDVAVCVRQFEAHRLELRTLEDYECLNGSRGPDFPPGSKFAYSNYGYILLGLIMASTELTAHFATPTVGGGSP